MAELGEGLRRTKPARVSKSAIWPKRRRKTKPRCPMRARVLSAAPIQVAVIA